MGGACFSERPSRNVAYLGRQWTLSRRISLSGSAATSFTQISQQYDCVHEDLGVRNAAAAALLRHCSNAFALLLQRRTLSSMERE